MSLKALGENDLKMLKVSAELSTQTQWPMVPKWNQYFPQDAEAGFFSSRPLPHNLFIRTPSSLVLSGAEAAAALQLA